MLSLIQDYSLTAAMTQQQQQNQTFGSLAPKQSVLELVRYYIYYIRTL